jgi:maleamate amidohydrolase
MEEIAIYEQQGFGNRIGFGKSPALLMVDFTVGFNDPAWFGGGNIDAAVRQTVRLLEFFRKQRLPIAHTRIVYAEDGSDVGIFATKIARLGALTETHAAGQIVPELSPLSGELVVRKTQASAFFNTGLAAWLIGRGVDTLIVCGCTTSGCVRASVIDAASWNFRTMVVQDCVGDRADGPHQANLFDMGQKYADIVSRDEVIACVAGMKIGAG